MPDDNDAVTTRQQLTTATMTEKGCAAATTASDASEASGSVSLAWSRDHPEGRKLAHQFTAFLDAQNI
jgi:hypothetical protein